MEEREPANQNDDACGHRQTTIMKLWEPGEHDEALGPHSNSAHIYSHTARILPDTYIVHLCL